MRQVEPVGEIARRRGRTAQLHRPQLPSAGDGQYESEQPAVRGDRARVVVVRAGQQRFGRPTRVRRAAIEVEERILARVDQLPAVRRPLGTEIPAASRGEPGTTRAPDLEHPDVPQGAGPTDIDRYATPLG